MPLEPKSSAQHYEEFRQLLLQTYNATGRTNPGSVLKRSLIALALLGPGNALVEANIEYEMLFDKYQDVLRTVLPPEIGFSHLHVDPPEVVLVTESGRFTLDAMSGGINSIVGMAWQVLMHSMEKNVSTIVIDEPENHLHPSMQRSLLGSFARAFPQCRFIIATHSPFIVTSMETSRVYGFVTDKANEFRSTELNVSDLSGTPNKILREVLLMPSLTPIWAEERIRMIIEDSHGDDPQEVANRVFAKMRELGMADKLNDFSGGEGATI